MSLPASLRSFLLGIAFGVLVVKVGDFLDECSRLVVNDRQDGGYQGQGNPVGSHGDVSDVVEGLSDAGVHFGDGLGKVAEDFNDRLDLHLAWSASSALSSFAPCSERGDDRCDGLADVGEVATEVLSHVPHATEAGDVA